MMVPALILGGGGHGRVVLDCLRARCWPVCGIVDPNRPQNLPEGVRWFSSDAAARLACPPESVAVFNGLGSVGVPQRRQRLFCDWQTAGYDFPPLVHPTAIVAPDVTLAAGVQVMAGALLQTGCRIGENVIINSRVMIDHDGQIDEHCHLAPGCVLSGGVRIGAGCHLGTAVVVIQGIEIGAGSVIGAGTVVIRNVPDHSQVVGPPPMRYL